MRQLPREITEFRALLLGWYLREGRKLPWRKTRDPYHILVSEFMLQQTQVVTVLRYYRDWLVKFPTLAALAAASEQEVLRAWQGLGYYHRARNLHRCAQQLLENGTGQLPDNVADLMRLPGIGRYTAGAVASFAFNHPAPILDGNVTRVLARLINLEIAVDTVPGQRVLWDLAEHLVREGESRQINSAIMELGALVCLARNPRCRECPVRIFCRATLPEALPRKRVRPAVREIVENYSWIRQGESVLLRQSSTSRWKGLWTLPPAIEPREGRTALVQLRHTITRYLVHLNVFPGEPPQEMTEDLSWHNVSSLADWPMPSPHRRAAEAILRVERSSSSSGES
jgi:A/G-specific adenine glycosylase